MCWIRGTYDVLRLLCLPEKRIRNWVRVLSRAPALLLRWWQRWPRIANTFQMYLCLFIWIYLDMYDLNTSSCCMDEIINYAYGAVAIRACRFRIDFYFLLFWEWKSYGVGSVMVCMSNEHQYVHSSVYMLFLFALAKLQ